MVLVTVNLTWSRDIGGLRYPTAVKSGRRYVRSY